MHKQVKFVANTHAHQVVLRDKLQTFKYASDFEFRGRWILVSNFFVLTFSWYFLFCVVVFMECCLVQLEIAFGVVNPYATGEHMIVNAVIDHDVPSNYNIVDANTISLLAKPL